MALYLEKQAKRYLAYKLMEWNVDDGISKSKVQCAAQGSLTAVYGVDAVADRSDPGKICQHGKDKILW
jgi:hypothetical protein